MDRSTLTRTGIAGAVAAAGLAAGGIAVSSSAGQGTTTAENTKSQPREHRGGHSQEAKALAEALGLEEATVQKAVKAVRSETRTDDEAAYVTALAKELGVSEAKVEAALEERRAESRKALAERLDDAVEAGTLTEADKTSVLKAFDAKLLGRTHGGRGGGSPATKSAD